MIDELRATLHRITLRHPAIPTTLEICETDLRGDQAAFVLVVVMQVPDRDSGVPGTIRVTFDLPQSTAGFAAFVRSCVVSAWDHEVDEAMHLDGRRLDDPHLRPDR